MRSRLKALLLVVVLFALPSVARADEVAHPAAVPASEPGEDFQTYVEGASRLEGRIMAPCCWTQTIDIHGSPIANELRSEIRRRLRAGESPDTIEASFVARYGPKILAVPDDNPLGGVATLLALAFGGAGVAGFFMLRRWTRVSEARVASEKKNPTAKPKRDGLDERLDRELADITDQA